MPTSQATKQPVNQSTSGNQNDDKLRRTPIVQTIIRSKVSYDLGRNHQQSRRHQIPCPFSSLSPWSHPSGRQGTGAEKNNEYICSWIFWTSICRVRGEGCRLNQGKRRNYICTSEYYSANYSDGSIYLSFLATVFYVAVQRKDAVLTKTGRSKKPSERNPTMR